MVIAPHADDAELAAFGLYSRSAQASIVTLTQGEVEAQSYRRLGLDKAAAARLKGRLRSWSSLAVPLWGGVPENRCVQLGYYCLQLAPMVAEPDKAQALAMQHDLQTPLPLKKRLRRVIQWVLAGRRWPEFGQDDFFRKAVRRHELFWVSGS